MEPELPHPSPLRGAVLLSALHADQAQDSSPRRSAAGTPRSPRGLPALKGLLLAAGASYGPSTSTAATARRPPLQLDAAGLAAAAAYALSPRGCDQSPRSHAAISPLQQHAPPQLVKGRLLAAGLQSPAADGAGSSSSMEASRAAAGGTLWGSEAVRAATPFARAAARPVSDDETSGGGAASGSGSGDDSDECRSGSDEDDALLSLPSTHAAAAGLHAAGSWARKTDSDAERTPLAARCAPLLAQAVAAAAAGAPHGRAQPAAAALRRRGSAAAMDDTAAAAASTLAAAASTVRCGGWLRLLSVLPPPQNDRAPALAAAGCTQRRCSSSSCSSGSLAHGPCHQAPGCQQQRHHQPAGSTACGHAGAWCDGAGSGGGMLGQPGSRVSGEALHLRLGQQHVHWVPDPACAHTGAAWACCASPA